MGIEENLSQIKVDLADGNFSVAVSYDHFERQFNEKNRMLILYSKVEYRAEDFVWSGVVPTVKIPYRDPALGYLVDGVIFSSVGVYSRAPGIVTDVDRRTLKAHVVEEPRLDIVNTRNSTVSIGYKRNAVQIIFKGSKQKVPIGIFLKALSGLPYKLILEQFAYRPQALLNGFPCEVPKGSEDLARATLYGVDSQEEPSVEDCVNMVYTAILPYRTDNRNFKYTLHWKMNRISAYLAGLHFKTKQKYEATLAVGNRAIGTYLDQDIDIPYFTSALKPVKKMGSDGRIVTVEEPQEAIEHFRLPRGHYITAEDAREIRRYDIHQLRVKTTRSFVLQEVSPVYFRVKGYKLAEDVSEVDGHAGDIVDDALLAKLNDTNLRYLDVITPEGRKVIHRSGSEVELGDFYSILNHFFTHVYLNQANTTQYEISNRVVIDYAKQITAEVEQTYNDIVTAIVGCTELRTLLDAFPDLPSSRLITYLRNNEHKEVAQSDLTNVMSRAITESRSSALMRETPGAMMPVQKGQYGRFDSFHAPDSDKIGSVQQLTITSRINPETSEVEAPYEIIRDGKPTGEIEYITASKEANKYIVSWDAKLDTDVVIARCNDELTTIDVTKVDYRDPSPFCDMSVSRMCIPFPGFSQPKRALMATKMNGQAVPVIFPERPRVSTGADTEVPCLYYTGKHILIQNAISFDDETPGVLELVGHTWKKNCVIYKFIYGSQAFDFSVPFTMTDQESLYNYNLNHKADNKYALDDIVFFNQSCDIKQYDFWTRMDQGAMPLVKDYTKPALALGVNIRVCYKTYGSVTVDDAMLISSRLVSDNTLSTIQITKYEYKRQTHEYFSDTDWCPPVHTWVQTSEPIIRIGRTKKDSDKSIKCRQTGEIVYCNKDDAAGEVEVWVATLHHAEIGDKVAGRFGDKSVIAKIIPMDMMPYDPETGEVIDICATPLGLPSRMNYGQVLELMLGAAMSKENKIAVCTPFYPNIKNDITELCDSLDIKPKRLFNPVYGKLTDRPVMVGIRYIMKLEQMSNLKLKAVGYPTSVDTVFGQPIDSANSSKGQAVGEMESWALSASGANGILNSLFTWYSDDEETRRRYFDTLACSDETIEHPWDESFTGFVRKGPNINALTTQTIMRMFGCDVDVNSESNKFMLSPLNMNDIQVSITPDALNSGWEGVKDFEWCKVPLAEPVINPFWIYNFPLHIILGVRTIKTLADGNAYFNPNWIDHRNSCIIPASNLTEAEKVKMLTGIEAVIALIKATTVEDALMRLRTAWNTASDRDMPGLSDIEGSASSDEAYTGTQEQAAVVVGSEEEADVLAELGDLAEVPMNVADVMRFLENMKRNGQTLDSLIWYDMPIMPRVFRQSNVIGDREHEHSFQTQLKSICSSRSTSQSIYEGLKALIGYGSSKREDLISIRGYFFGHDSQSGQHGKVRSSILSKRVGFSGRVVITPMEDPSISPFFVGLPWRVLCVELGTVLGIRLYNRRAEIARTLEDEGIKIYIENMSRFDWKAIAESLPEFNPYILSQHFGGCSRSQQYRIFYYLRSIVKHIIEGNVRSDGMVLVNGEWEDPAELPPGTTIDCAVVISGRQPTLHKKSNRSYFVLVVDGYSMRIHPLVCSAYNADFDGDTMWHLQLFGEDKIEACQTLSVMQDLISEKDGSYTLSISQDTALGLYSATIYKDNAVKFSAEKGDFCFFDNIEELKMQLEYGDLHYTSAVVFHNLESNSYYCSTAGRVLVNSVVPGAFTQKPTSDPHGIIECVLGKEYIQCFKEMEYDSVWTTTSLLSAGREKTTIVSDVQLATYELVGSRKSIMVTQALYEIGLVASDITSVTFSLDDIKSTVNVEDYMHEPRAVVQRLNSLYQLGLISEKSRKQGSVHAWENAKKVAQEAIINKMDVTSNIYYMMYSGARGKPDQVMQSIGFIGTISKSRDTDIEYPILKGYGDGLSSFDLMQTRHAARIGVISTQAGTKDTGYATRQSVYMNSGMNICEDDCGIFLSRYKVNYGLDSLSVKRDNGTISKLDDLIGEFVDSDTPGFDLMKAPLTRSGYMINQEVLDIILQNGITELKLLDETVHIVFSIDEEWRKSAVEHLYSYALPFTDKFKVTDKTVDWIEAHGLKEIVAVANVDSDEVLFDREAYLPVDYDTSRYVITLGGKEIGEEALYTNKVLSSSPGFYYYRNLLTPSGSLTEQAFKYLTKKKIRCIEFEGGDVANIAYSITKLFKSTVVGRISAGLLHLDTDYCITPETVKSVEEYQLDYIPVRTGITCLSRRGMCACCYGKSLSTKRFLRIGDNIGIAADQAMCEPLSQSTLNVAHTGGRRGSGIGLETGLGYYTRMLKGSMTTERTQSLKERFAPIAGYVIQDTHNKSFIKIVNDEDKEAYSLSLDDAERLNVPSGAYVDVNDTIVSGLPDLKRYDSNDVFQAALKTRYMLLQEYDKIFSSLDVSARNTEILARAQTSICYLNKPGGTDKTKDTGEEAMHPTGLYRLTVSNQSQVVNWFTGVAGFSFENVANMILMWLFTPEGLSMGSTLGNIVTGTRIGSEQASFIPKGGSPFGTKYHRSSVHTAKETVLNRQRSGDFSQFLEISAGSEDVYSTELEEEIFSRLLGGNYHSKSLPGNVETPADTRQENSTVLEFEAVEDTVVEEVVDDVSQVEKPPVLEVEIVSDDEEDGKVQKDEGDTTTRKSDVGKLNLG